MCENVDEKWCTNALAENERMDGEEKRTKKATATALKLKTSKWINAFSLCIQTSCEGTTACERILWTHQGRQ